MTETLRVGVSACGGGCGTGIMKALFQSKLAVDVFTADITPLAAGLYRGRNAPGRVLPKSEDCIEAWVKWAEEMKLVALFPGSDHDLLPFAEHKAEFEAVGCFVMVGKPESVKIANDKIATVQALREVGLDAPESAWGESAHGHWPATIHNPVVVKPAFGMTSRGVHVCHDTEEVEFYWKRTTNPIIQEYLDGPEYTCAILYDKWREIVGTFAARRDLYMGSTGRCEVRPFPEMREYLLEWARRMKRFGFLGPINIQLKDVPGRGPVCFEINARCSGSTAIRAHFGYNEPELALRHFVLREKLGINNQLRTGYAFVYRDELFLDHLTEDDVLSGKAEKGSIPSWL